MKFGLYKATVNYLMKTISFRNVCLGKLSFSHIVFDQKK